MTTLPTRRFPVLDTEVSALGYGCMGISWAYTTPDQRDDEAGVTIIREALNAGVTFIDTADVYGAGHNEGVVARALAGADPQPILATKGGLIGDFRDGKHVLWRNGRPEHLRQTCEESLRRLGRDSVDLYYLHRVDPEVPLEESWGALAELVAQGKVRALGLSDVDAAQCATAHAIHPVAAVQSELSLWTREPMTEAATGDVVGWTRDHDAVFVPFSPLGRGYLTGSLDATSIGSGDFRADHPRFTGEAPDQNQVIVDVVRAVAARHDATPAAVALAWVLALGEHVIPIPGTTKPAHLHANLAAASLRLTDQDLAELNEVPEAVGGKTAASAP